MKGRIMAYTPKVMSKGDVTVVAETATQENDLRFGRGYAVLGEAKQDPKGNLTTDVKKGTEVETPAPAAPARSASNDSTSAADTPVSEATSDTAAKAATRK